ncbi:MAG: chemotaxis protein [Candidatus Binataceae bacterium]|jgi:signal transduction histidine kinase
MRLIGTAVAAGLLFTPSLAANEYGSAADARAVLERAIPELKADKVHALAEFNAGENGFKDRDLYVFCFNAGDGALTSHPSLMGRDVRTLVDKTGAPFGRQMYSQAQEGTISTNDYMFSRPGATEPSPKESFFTKIGDQVCGVGFYK